MVSFVVLKGMWTFKIPWLSTSELEQKYPPHKTQQVWYSETQVVLLLEFWGVQNYVLMEPGLHLLPSAV